MEDIVLTGNALVVFIPSLDHECRNDGQDDEQEQSAHHTYTIAARDDKSMGALRLRPVRAWSGVSASCRCMQGMSTY